jgi:hypothetical protein
MSDKTEKKGQEPVQAREIVFKCQFCGETKPLVDLVVMRQYFPQKSSCKTCATRTSKPEPTTEEQK